jgi:lysozyme family protein
MAKYTYEQLKDEYQTLWNSMKIIRDTSSLHNVETKVNLYKETYKAVERSTGVPWQLVAVIHIREAGLSDVGVFKGVLHNGEKIVNTGRKTRIVPANRGPFSTWHDAAVDALKLKGFDKIKQWPVSRMLWALEPYNGYGYRNKGLRSPYLWASTNHQQRGKYVADHVFDPNAIDSQMGAAAMLKYLGIGSAPMIPPETAILIGTTVGAAYFENYLVPIIIGGGLIIAACIAYRIYKNRKK